MNDKEYEFIFKEIDTSWEYINNRRNSAINFFKIYLSLIVLFGSYISFINMNIVEGESIRVTYGIFGFFFTLLIFMIGWGLLDSITRITANTIKHYKHLIEMRKLISETWSASKKFKDYSISLLNSNHIPVKASRHIPLLGAGFNFIVILTCYYFLSIIFNGDVVYTISIMSTILIFTVLFYSNVIDKHYYELLISQRITPTRDEIKSRNIVERYIKFIKHQKRYSVTHRFLELISVLYIVNTLFIAFFLILDLKYHIFIQVILLIVVSSLRYVILNFKVEKIRCEIIVIRK